MLWYERRRATEGYAPRLSRLGVRGSTGRRALAKSSAALAAMQRFLYGIVQHLMLAR